MVFGCWGGGLGEPDSATAPTMTLKLESFLSLSSFFLSASLFPGRDGGEERNRRAGEINGLNPSPACNSQARFLTRFGWGDGAVEGRLRSRLYLYTRHSSLTYTIGSSSGVEMSFRGGGGTGGQDPSGLRAKAGGVVGGEEYFCGQIALNGQIHAENSGWKTVATVR